jgi:hypothetical protein
VGWSPVAAILRETWQRARTYSYGWSVRLRCAFSR